MKETRSEVIDADVAAHYRELADDHVPERLDQIVMEVAGKELRKNSGWQRAWYRPLTLAATVGLSFAFILQLGDLSMNISPSDELDAAPALSPRAFQDAGRANEQRFEDLQAESDRSMQSAPEMISPPANSTATPTASVDGNQQPASPGCTADERRSASSWWRCIRELEMAGNSQAAEVELQALLKAFPGFERPE